MKGNKSTTTHLTALMGGMRKKSCKKSNKSHKYGNTPKNKSRKSSKMKGGSVLGNALPSLVLFGLAKGMRSKKHSNNSNHNKSRKMRKSRKGRKSRRM